MSVRRARELRKALSMPEAMLWRELKLGQTGARFRRQHRAGPYVLDFYCPQTGLDVQGDGRPHDWRPEADARRDAELARHGVCVLRTAAIDVLDDPTACAGLIAQACEEVAQWRSPGCPGDFETRIGVRYPGGPPPA